MKKLILSTMGLLATGMLSAQIYIFEDFLLNTTSVTNEGKAVGHPAAPASPFVLWDAVGNDYKIIGGTAPGDGIGGHGSFSDDGKILTAPNHFDAIPVATTWSKTEYPEFADYTFKSVIVLSEYNIFAYGYDKNKEKGIFIKTVNNGTKWNASGDVISSPDGSMTPKPILCGGVAGYYVLLGGKGILYETSGNGALYIVNIIPEGGENNVDEYRAMDFMGAKNPYEKYSECGVVGVKNLDGSYEVWYSTDYLKTFNVATGVSGVPASMAHFNDVYWMGTENGDIQKSTDKGATWTTVFTVPGKDSVRLLKFTEDGTAIALCGNTAYISLDLGKTWAESKGAAVERWNDAVWDKDTITLVGDNGKVLQSTDNGASYSAVSISGNPTVDFDAILYFNSKYNIIGADGQFFGKEDVPSRDGFCGGIYNIEEDTWTPLPSTNYGQQSVYSSPWRMSGDGKHVVGIIQNLNPDSKNVQAYACIWDGTEGYTILGNKYASIGRACRANAVSYDGSVVAGWQDIFGPWFGSVWRKGADGEYSHDLMFLNEEDRDKNIDYSKDYDSAYAQLLGYCQAVSEDGKWIGGNGNATTAIKAPWLWNEEKGVISILEDGYYGCVADVANDGSMAIGWEGTGQAAWIWTPEAGAINLNDYAKDVLHLDLGDFYISSVYDMSPNGRYVTGYGFLGENPLAYVLDMKPIDDGIEAIEANQVKAAVYPNPVSSELHVDVPYGNGEIATTMRLFDMQGRAVMSRQLTEASNSFSVENLAAGMYILRVEAGRSSKVFKVVVRH